MTGPRSAPPTLRRPAVERDLTAMHQVVLLLVDGIRPDILETLFSRGDLPSVARLVGAGGRVNRLCSVFPSTTGPAHLPFLTGRYPGPCHVPGIRWLDPQRYGKSIASPFRFRSYIGPGATWIDRDLSRSVSSIFDVVRDHACAGSHIHRGLRSSRNLTRWSKLVEPVVSYVTEDWSRLDRRIGSAVARAVASGTTFVFGAFYGADSHAHKWGPFHERTLESYRRIDDALSPLADVQDRLAGDERPLILVVSDHGQTETRAHLDLQRLVERVVGRCLAHPTIWQGLFDAAAAVMVSGNAMAHVYLRGRRWGDAQYLDAPSGDAERLVDALLAEPAVDQVIGRASSGGAIVRSKQGRARLTRTGSRIRYDAEGGDDPFSYSNQVHGAHDDRRWLELTWNSNYPDAPAQILQLLESSRSGHLIVTARPGWDLRERFEKPRHCGSHGSLHRDHMLTPFMCSRPLLDGPRRTVDVFPTMLDALGLTAPPGLDGRSLWPSAQPVYTVSPASLASSR